MSKRPSKRPQRPAERPVDHQAIGNALGAEPGKLIDAPAGQIAAPQLAANVAAMQRPRAPLIQLLRNVGRYQMGETLRATPDQAKAQGLDAGDYRELKPAELDQDNQADQINASGIEPAALLSARANGAAAESALRTQAIRSRRRRDRVGDPDTWE